MARNGSTTSATLPGLLHRQVASDQIAEDFRVHAMTLFKPRWALEVETRDVTRMTTASLTYSTSPAMRGVVYPGK